MYMSDMISRFKAYLTEQEKSDNTIKSYIFSAICFHSAVVKDISEISKNDVIAYKSELMRKYRSASVNARLCGLNEYFDFIQRPDLKVKCLKIHKKFSAENIIMLSEYKIIRDGLLADEKYKHYFMVRFLGETGCRVNELVQLRAEHLRQGYAEILTKGKMRRIYFPERLQTDCMKWLTEKRKNRGLLFSNGSGNQMTESGVWKLLKQFAVRYGVDEQVVYPHSFRHMFAIEFLRRDNDISLLSDLLGHESISTTSIYLKLSSDEQRNRVSKAVDW